MGMGLAVYNAAAWGTCCSAELTYTIMEQQVTPLVPQVLPEEVDMPAALPVDIPMPPAPPAQPISWAERAEKLKALTIKTAKIMTIVAAGIALLQLLYAGVLFLL